MRTQLALTLFLLALVIPASGQNGKEAFSDGIIQPSCAPWDGAAMAITLTQAPVDSKTFPKPPYVTINIWRELPLHDGQVFKFTYSSNLGSVGRCVKEGDCQIANSAEIRLDSVKVGVGATGHYDIHFKNGDSLSGSFDVKWRDFHQRCG